MSDVGEMFTEQKLILLVEDNPDDVLLTQRAFKKTPFKVKLDVVNDGEAALDYLFRRGQYASRGPEEPVVILLDLKLPKVDGLEVLQQIKSDERTKMLPVVILTSSKEQEDLLRGYSLGVNSYIRKPVDYERFLIAVQQLGIFWLSLNEPPPLKS